MADALRFVFSRRVFRRNLLVALAVGCVFSLAHQLDVILREPFTAPLAVKLFFNFLIPFIVSSISAAINREPREKFVRK
ncbi:MAG: hypothetical protein LC776_10310 [Acidobacteria bacterium]|nr:hypothetical protein [Acidobacteriota bacterium]